MIPDGRTLLDGKTLLDALAIAAYVTDPDGRITYFNQAAAGLWGRSPVLGQETWCGSWKLFHADGSAMAHENCPMAVALKQGTELRGVEAIAERPDGSRVRILPHPTLLRDDDNAIAGAINVIVDISDLRAAENDSARLAAIVTSSDDAIVSKTLDGRITSWNEGAMRIFGYDHDEMVGEHISKIIPPELRHEESEIIRRIQAGERIDHFETVRIAKGDRRIDVSLAVSPVRDRSGRIVGASKVARDITSRKQAEKVETLLVGELHHRVRNTLATVQAVATQSLRHANTSAAFVSGFTGRIASLSRVHGLLTDQMWAGADLHALVRDQVMLGAVDDDRIAVSGPALRLPAQIALHIAMVLHELGTNARKHGALADATGRLAIEWRVDNDNVLSVDWIESGGPRVRPRRRRGFGVRLIEEGLTPHSGHVSLGFAKSGLIGRIRVPLPRGGGSPDSLFQGVQGAIPLGS